MSGIIGTLIGVIIVLVLMGLVWWAITQLLPLLPIPEPFARIIDILLRVILVLIVLWVILVLLGAAGMHIPGPFRFGAGSPAPGGVVYAAHLQGVLG
jgi:hypothetical protein